jgi:hypothetical protein
MNFSSDEDDDNEDEESTDEEELPRKHTEWFYTLFSDLSLFFVYLFIQFQKKKKRDITNI